MKTNLRMLWVAVLCSFASAASLAGSVGPLTTFTPNTPALASEVNGNFSAVRTAVNDNDSRITTLETAVDTLKTSLNCPAVSMVQVGPVCIDKYEASVWEIPPANTALIAKVKAGTVTLADLTSPTAVANGVIQRGADADDYEDNTDPALRCPNSGNGCKNLYAVSIPGVTPSRFINWFQAVAVARNAGKRLPTNQEWQAAALGTPAPGTDNGTTSCKFGGGLTPVNTGSRSDCVSDVGAFDMVGNLWEWVAEWVPRSSACPGWGAFSDDVMCLAGALDTSNSPGALKRGGASNGGAGAGVFAVDGNASPSGAGLVTGSAPLFGFRAAR